MLYLNLCCKSGLGKTQREGDSERKTLYLYIRMGDKGGISRYRDGY